MTRQHRVPTALAALTCSVALLTACGSDDDGAAPADSVAASGADADTSDDLPNACPVDGCAISIASAEADGDELMAYRHEGFWKPMDTLRERNELEAMWAGDDAPWRIWE